MSYSICNIYDSVHIINDNNRNVMQYMSKLILLCITNSALHTFCSSFTRPSTRFISSRELSLFSPYRLSYYLSSRELSLFRLVTRFITFPLESSPPPLCHSPFYQFYYLSLESSLFLPLVTRLITFPLESSLFSPLVTRPSTRLITFPLESSLFFPCHSPFYSFDYLSSRELSLFPPLSLAPLSSIHIFT